MLKIDYSATVVLFFTFVLVVGFLLTDMFIAIINDSYLTAKVSVFGDARLQVRVDIIGHARIRYVGKYQSCMV